MPSPDPRLPGRLANVGRSPQSLLGAWLWSRHPAVARIAVATALLVFAAFVLWVFAR